MIREDDGTERRAKPREIADYFQGKSGWPRGPATPADDPNVAAKRAVDEVIRRHED
jgi:hypothetical protein